MVDLLGPHMVQHTQCGGPDRGRLSPVQPCSTSPPTPGPADARRSSPASPALSSEPTAGIDMPMPGKGGNMPNPALNLARAAHPRARGCPTLWCGVRGLCPPTLASHTLSRSLATSRSQHNLRGCQAPAAYNGFRAHLHLSLRPNAARERAHAPLSARDIRLRGSLAENPWGTWEPCGSSRARALGPRAPQSRRPILAPGRLRSLRVRQNMLCFNGRREPKDAALRASAGLKPAGGQRHPPTASSPLCPAPFSRHVHAPWLGPAVAEMEDGQRRNTNAPFAVSPCEFGKTSGGRIRPRPTPTHQEQCVGRIKSNPHPPPSWGQGLEPPARPAAQRPF